MVHNTHSRWLAAEPPVIAALLSRAWSGAADDPFPIDWIQPRRDNPADIPVGALIPGVTRLSHAFMPFRFEHADATTWRVSTPYGGWHGFEFVPENGGTRVTHTLVIPALPAPLRLLWAAFIGAGHDWVVEVLFDRLAHAAQHATPIPPTPPPPPRVRLGIALWNRVPGRVQSALRETLASRMG